VALWPADVLFDITPERDIHHLPVQGDPPCLRAPGDLEPEVMLPPQVIAARREYPDTLLSSHIHLRKENHGLWSGGWLFFRYRMLDAQLERPAHAKGHPEAIGGGPCGEVRHVRLDLMKAQPQGHDQGPKQDKGRDRSEDDSSEHGSPSGAGDKHRA